MAYPNQNSDMNVTEFNSNVAVIVRTNRIIDNINESRNGDDVAGMIKWILALYKEVYVEMSDAERKIRTRLLSAIKKAQSLPGDTGAITGAIGNGRILYELDILDSELRDLAKKHGMLSSNKEDPRYAMLG